MEKRIRALKAIILVVVMVVELFGVDAMRVVADTISVMEDTTISTNDSNDYAVTDCTLTVSSTGNITGTVYGSGGTIVNQGSINKIEGNIAVDNQAGATIQDLQSSVGITNAGHIISATYSSISTLTNSGTIDTLNVQNPGYSDSTATVNMNAGTISSLNVMNYTGLNPIINYAGGTITSLTAEGTNGADLVVSGNHEISQLKGTVNVSGSGMLMVSGTLQLEKGYTGENLGVTKDTALTVKDGNTVQVNYNDHTYSISSATEQKITELAGNTVKAVMDDAATMTAETPFTSETYMYGEQATAVYMANDDYYFPENYTATVTVGSGTLDITRVNAKKINLAYTFKDENTGVEISLPAATAKTTQDAPTGLTGGIEKVTGVTTAMEYAGSETSDTWTQVTGITDSGTLAMERGTWYFRYKETDEKKASAATKVIVKGEGAASVEQGDVNYGTKPEPKAETSTNIGKTAVIEYKKATSDDTTYSQTVPIAVGNYTVRATFAGTDDYGEAVATTDFSIRYLETPDPPYTLVGTKGENAYYTSEVTVTPADGYQISRTLDGTYQDTLVIKETMEASNIYLVKKSTGEKTDAVVLEAINIDTADPILNVTDGETYKVKSKDLEVTDANLSSVTINGVAQSVSGQSFNMNLEESSDAYEIIVKDKAGRSVEATIYVKRDAQTAPTGLTGGVEKVTGVTTAMEYAQNADAADWTAVTGITDGGTITLAKGTWYFRYKETDTKQASPAVKVMVEEKQKEPEKEPEKEKLTGSGKVAAVDVYYGKTPYVQISSETNDTGKAVIVYKEKSKPDTAYTSAVPVKVGTYTVRVTLPGNDTYKEVVMATEFKISYAPAPALAYTLEGTKGENGYYTSDVIIRPAQGYTIARTLNGTYGQMLQVEKTQQASQIYLKNAAGEMTDAISIEAIKIKQGTPTVNLEHGKTYYGDSQKLVVQDDYLSQVYVNGVFQNLNGTELVLQLGSNNGKKKYEITAVDVAGNKKTILVTVAAAWMKTGIIPDGVLVNLETGNGYKLGTGNWKVAGDSTSYSGGTDFYVKKDGSYTFGKQ